ncbi:hypothetical protein Tco_0021386 [Tanacetum coccineum]
MSMTIQLSVKDKILATLSETFKVENAPAEMLRDLDQQMEREQMMVVLYGLNCIVSMSMKFATIQYGVRGMILAAQSEAFKQENILAEILHGLDQQMERIGDKNLYFMDRI